MYLITKTQIVKASNMANARSITDGGKDVAGNMLADSTSVKEVSAREALKYFSVVDEDDFIYSDYSEVLEKDDNDFDLSSSSTTLDSMGVHTSTVDFLRSENKRLARLVDKYKNIRQEASNMVYQAAYDSFSAFNLSKIPKPNLNQSFGLPETAVAVLSDWQLGKLTPDYNSEVLEKRIEIYADKLLEIAEIQRAHHPVNNLHVWILGDIVEGEEIFPGQSHLIDSGIYRQVGVNGPRILSTFFQKMLASFQHVHVTAVIGNHGAVGGRARKQHDPETNMDRLLYKICQLIFESEDRISFNIPEGKGERNWYAVDYIGDYGTLLIHGDQMPSPSLVNSYYKKIMGWKDGAIPERFDDVFMGHYHQQFKMTIGSTILRVSGSPESYNTYAQEYFHSMSRPCQHLMFVHPNKGVTSEYSIWLDEV